MAEPDIVASGRRLLIGRTAGSRTRTLVEGVLVLSVPSLALWIAGVAAWTPPYRPDSEFYYSLSLFGDEVTDRAADPAYYWTRLGVVAPLRFLTWAFGVEGGYSVWRWLLLSAAVVPAYYLGRRLWGRAAGAGMAAFIGVNTVLLTALGNPYPTGAVLSLLCAELLVCLLAIHSEGPAMFGLLATAGGLVGWLLMCNQSAVVFGVLVFAPFIGVLLRRGRTGLIGVATAVVSSGLGVGSFLLVGRTMFPGLDWIATTRFYASQLNLSAFHSRDHIWVTTSTWLMVPALVVIAVVLVAVHSPSHRVTMSTAGIALALCLVYAVWNQTTNRAALLEIPSYAAFLWGPTLATGALVVGSLVSALPPRVATGTICAGAMMGVLAGRLFVSPFPIWPIGVVLATIVVGVVLLGLTLRADTVLGIAMIGVAIVLYFGATQILQNGTPTNVATISPRVPSWSAYDSPDAGRDYSLAYRVERWIVESTSRSDTVRVWPGVPRLDGVAAMNFMGPNSAAMGLTFTKENAVALRSVAPVHVVVLGDSEDQTSSMLRQMEGSKLALGVRRCRSFAASAESSGGVVCLVRVHRG